MNRLILLLVSLWTLTAVAYSVPMPFTPMGFSMNLEVTYPVSPDSLYDMMTGDISGWWDHSFSEKPLKLYIEPKPGGGFIEIFDEKGNGVKHATVIYADRGKRLRFEGPLGFSGSAVNMVVTYDYDAIAEGTRLKMSANIIGQLDENQAKVIESVWQHFLIERLKPFVVQKILK